MSNRKILIKNSFWLGLLEVVSKLIMFGVTVTMVRYFGPKEYGAYNLSSAYVAFFLILADLGITQVATREIAKHKDETQKYLNNLLTIKLFLASLTVIIVYISTHLFNTSQARDLILTICVYQLCQSTLGIFTAVFIAWEKMEIVFVSRLIFYLGVLGATFWTVSHQGSATDLAKNYVISTVFSLAMAELFVRKLKLTIGLEFNKQLIWILTKEALPLLATGVVGTIYANIDTLMIGKYWGQEKVGFYQAAYKILFAFQSINFINNAIFPRMSILIHENNKRTLDRLLKTVMGLSMLGLVPLAMLITWQKDLVVTKIYGENYLIAGGVMVVLIWSGVVNYFRIMLSNLQMAQGKQKVTFYAVLVGMLVNLGLNIWLIPLLGFEVAATNLLISELAILGVTLFSLKNFFLR